MLDYEADRSIGLGKTAASVAFGLALASRSNGQARGIIKAWKRIDATRLPHFFVHPFHDHVDIRNKGEGDSDFGSCREGNQNRSEHGKVHMRRVKSEYRAVMNSYNMATESVRVHDASA
jgi:hypothetical protein